MKTGTKRRLLWLALAVLHTVLQTACSKPDPADLARQQGNVLFKKGEYNKAGAEYEKAISLDSKPELKQYETAAFAYMKGGELDKAAELLLKTLEFKKTKEEKLAVYRNITGMYLQASSGGDAEKYFFEILNLEPNDASAMGWIAEIYSSRGGARANAKETIPADLSKALEWYEKILANKPDDPGPWVNKRIIYNKLVGYYTGLKAQAEADALANKKDKETAEDFRKQAVEAQAKIDETTKLLEDANLKVTELVKARAAAQKADAGTDAGP